MRCGKYLNRWGWAKIVICGFPREIFNAGNKDKTNLGGAPIACSSGSRLWGATSSYAGEVHVLRRGFDAARFLKFASRIIARQRKCRYRKSEFVSVIPSSYGIYPPLNSMTKKRIMICFLGSNSGKLGINKCLALSHIAGGFNISDEMAKTTTQNKLLTLSPSDISQTASKK